MPAEERGYGHGHGPHGGHNHNNHGGHNGHGVHSNHGGHAGHAGHGGHGGPASHAGHGPAGHGGLADQSRGGSAAPRYSCERFPSAAERFSVAPSPPGGPGPAGPAGGGGPGCYSADGSPPSPAPPGPRAPFGAAASPERSPRRRPAPARYLAGATPVVSHARYVPPSAHVPVERYVPRPGPASAPYYCSERYSEPYRQYRPYQRARPPARRCCPQPGAPNPATSGGSPSISRFPREFSSSPLLTHGDGGGLQQERYPREFGSTLEPGATYVEYVGASGGRHVSCTPPGARLPPDQTCCLQARRCAPPALNWRPVASIGNNLGPTPQPSNMGPGTGGSPSAVVNVPSNVESPPPTSQPPQPDPPSRSPSPQRRPVTRSLTRKEQIKNYVKRETALFFGVEEEHQEEQKRLWLERRRRLAERRYGPLRVDNENDVEIRYRNTGVEAYGASGAAPREPRGRVGLPDLLPGPSSGAAADQPDRPLSAPQAQAQPPEPRLARHQSARPLRRKDSVARLTLSGISYVVTALSKHKPRTKMGGRSWSRSYAPDAEDNLQRDDDSLDAAPTTSPRIDDVSFFEPEPDDIQDDEQQQSPRLRREVDDIDAVQFNIPETVGGWKRSLRISENIPIGTVGAGQRISDSLVERVKDNSDRRQYGMGFVGKLCGRSHRKSVALHEPIKKQLDDMTDYRPYFTYWVSTAQTLILIAALFCYGLGPVGLDRTRRSGQVLVTSLSLQQVEYQEPANFWLGPRAADLIHLGAKFAPCMRKDARILREVSQGQQRERDTACCIRNDDSGCVQSSKADCSNIISTWKKWSAGDSGPGGRISGSVCGLDPKFCDAPASVAPFEWPDDITKWPICRKPHGFPRRHRDKTAEHMACEVIGHPCCIGVHAACRITTREYCDFVGGHFHEEASLCSQVSCLDDVCGMLPFVSPGRPDQFYRLWTSLFLHAGVLHLLATLLLQWVLMRDLEKLAGPLRIGIIYLGSGMGGNLASAIFVPYRAEVGPAGAHFGLLACLIVEVLKAWPLLKRPKRALCRLLSVVGALLLLGVLPWIDNYAHLFGFIFGFILSYALLPFVSVGPFDRQKKISILLGCLVGALVLFILLVALFYIIPVYDCEICTYFTCIPFTRDFCASQNIDFKREEPVV